MTRLETAQRIAKEHLGIDTPVFHVMPHKATTGWIIVFSDGSRRVVAGQHALDLNKASTR